MLRDIVSGISDFELMVIVTASLMYPLLPLVSRYGKDLDLAPHKIAQKITKIVFTASQDDKVAKSMQIWRVAPKIR